MKIPFPGRTKLARGPQAARGPRVEAPETYTEFSLVLSDSLNTSEKIHRLLLIAMAPCFVIVRGGGAHNDGMDAVHTIGLVLALQTWRLLWKLTAVRIARMEPITAQ